MADASGIFGICEPGSWEIEPYMFGFYRVQSDCIALGGVRTGIFFLSSSHFVEKHMWIIIFEPARFLRKERWVGGVHDPSI